MTEEDCVELKIDNIPVKLLDDFDELVVKPNYPGGRAEALRALMQDAVQEQRAKGGSA